MWEPERTLELSFLITEASRAQAGALHRVTQHHTLAFPPAGRVVLRIRSMCALPSTPREPTLAATAGGVETTQRVLGAASTDVCVP